MSTVVKSAVRAEIKKAGMRVAGDFWNALDGKVRDHVKQAAEKAKADGRKTVRAADLG